MYKDYGRILRRDVINASKNKANLDHTYAISRRVGLSQIPLGCVFLRFVSLALASKTPREFFSKLSYFQTVQVYLLFFALALTLKVTVGLGLLIFSVISYNSDEASLEATKKKVERDIWMDRLSNIERFTVWKGKIIG